MPELLYFEIRFMVQKETVLTAFLAIRCGLWQSKAAPGGNVAAGDLGHPVAAEHVHRPRHARHIAFQAAGGKLPAFAPPTIGL